MSTQQNNIIPKDCAYGCNTRIYWSVADNAYFEVFTKKKHICKNRSLSNNTSTIINTKPTFYNKKPTIPEAQNVQFLRVANWSNYRNSKEIRDII